MVPLGYTVKDRKVVVIKDEADRVRTILQRYLELGSLNRLLDDLRARKLLTRVRTLSTGRTVGGIPFARGALGHLLRNRFYMTISLAAFLSPTLVQAAVGGRLPRGVGIARLRDAPAEWSRQHAMLGLAC